MASLALAGVARWAFSCLFVHSKYGRYSWYFVPVFMLRLLITPYVIHRTYRLVSTLRWRLATPVGVGALLLGCLGHTYRLDLDPWRAQLNRWSSDEEPMDWEMASYEGTEWMNANLPGDAVIGSGDAGVLGYFSTRRVENIDGLANSVEFFQAQVDGRAGEWVQAAGIDYLANVVFPRQVSGCAFMARRMWQGRNRLPGTCEIVHEGAVFGEPARRFRLWSFTPIARPPNTVQ